MSHFKERSEKNCLNCGTEVNGRYCHVCGQENIEPKETVWHLVTHFFNDITHFDGKFFSTLKYLITKPGFLSAEYMKGRRNSYLNPIRMYVFTSAFFFLIFFSFFKVKENNLGTTSVNGKTTEQIEKMDSLTFDKFTRAINEEDKDTSMPMTRKEFQDYIDSARKGSGIHVGNGKYRTMAAYDSALASGKSHDNWFQQKFMRKQIEINEKYKNNPDGILHSFIELLLHSIPQILFVSLPLFALVLYILYARWKQFYYVGHAIFTLHLYIFTFIAMLVIFGISKINQSLHWIALPWLNGLLSLGVFFYTYKAMRKFYKQGRGKTIVKFILLIFGLLAILIFLFLVFTFLSFFKI